MKKPLPIGISDFRMAVEEYYYVDKTLLIRDFLDNRPMVSLFTRPRRFGKTLNMDMFRVFFEKTEEDTSMFFQDKMIWRCGETYTSYQGKYPVIFLSFKDVKCTSWEDTFWQIRELITIEYQRHIELETSDQLNVYEKEKFKRIARGNAGNVECQMALGLLSHLLSKHHNEKVVIIIDEYDTPIEQGHICGFYQDVINFMRNLFFGGLKDNSALAFGFMTGILRVAKESYSILDRKYSQYFGFTKEEIQEMLEYYDVREKYDEVCEWYDGYLFGEKEISYVYEKEVLNKIDQNVTAIMISQAIFSGDTDKLQKQLDKFMVESISLFDTANEGFYHGMMLGFCAVLSNRYHVRSNRESGLGRFDIMLIPKIRSIPAFIYEFKYTKDEKVNLEMLADEALKQIDEKKYEAELIDSDITEIIKIGIAFRGKSAIVRSKHKGIVEKGE